MTSTKNSSPRLQPANHPWPVAIPHWPCTDRRRQPRQHPWKTIWHPSWWRLIRQNTPYVVGEEGPELFIPASQAASSATTPLSTQPTQWLERLRLCRKQRSRCYVTGNQQRQHRDATTTASDGTNRGWFQQQPHFPRHASYQQCRIRNDGSGSSSRSAICESSTGAGLPGTQELACSS